MTSTRPSWKEHGMGARADRLRKTLYECVPAMLGEDEQPRLVKV